MIFEENVENTNFFVSTHWFFFISIIVLIIFFIMISLIIFKKGKIYGLMTSFIFGILSMVILLSISNSINWEEGEQSQVLKQTRELFGIIIMIFIWAISIMIPIYMFIIVISFIMSENINKINKKTYAVSFISLMSLSFLGILMALLMIPLIITIPQEWFNDSVITNPTEKVDQIVSYFTKWWLILGMVISAIIIGSLIRLFIKDNEKITSISNICNKLLFYVNNYFKYVVFFVPFVIITRFSMLGISETGVAQTTIRIMGVYIGIFWFGALIIFTILFLLNISLSKANLTKREKSSILLEEVITVFGNQNTQASLPTTRTCVTKLGVSEEISFLTPTQGTMMGMVMCNGFTPMLIVMLSLANYGMFNFWPIFTAIFIIMALSISTSGSGSADYTIILATLGALGVSSSFYMNAIMPIHEFNERTIIKPNNVLGHIAATQITEINHRNPKK